jgi:hypothetical protein
MDQFPITGSRLALPRVFDNGVEIAPENAPSVHLAAVNFDVGTAVVKRNVFGEHTEIALAVKLTGRDDTFACLFLDLSSANLLAQKLLEVTT